MPSLSCQRNTGSIFQHLKKQNLPTKEIFTTNLNRFVCYEKNEEAKKLAEQMYNNISTNRWDLRKKSDRQKVVDKLHKLSEYDNCENCESIVDKFKREVINEKWADNDLQARKPSKKLLIETLKPYHSDGDTELQRNIQSFCQDVMNRDFRKNSTKQCIADGLDKLSSLSKCNNRKDVLQTVQNLNKMFCPQNTVQKNDPFASLQTGFRTLQYI